MTPTLSERKTERAPRAAFGRSWVSDRIPAFMRLVFQSLDGFEEGLRTSSCRAGSVIFPTSRSNT